MLVYERQHGDFRIYINLMGMAFGGETIKEFQQI